MNAKSRGYTLIIVLMCAFALTIYGAYSPARKAQKQQIVCIKFKKGVESTAVEQHMNGFASLKHEIPQIVGYTSGKTIRPNQAVAEYDVVHYLTFQSENDIHLFEKSAAYKEFIAQNEGVWQKTLTVNADIRP
ncbi:Dabb family protein [Spirosoma utsteinense]|uniref:Heme-degrading monooxygenase HmoA n=1 Tax=Spirosoma utsteinense TaxID=2585773 RepID=A0ABR6W371_9BACT|nr:Dabb family protein [Spirosoma utsteinense]MBC3785233.1 heme-degrading monooxygenase HmoA [Spirosoma utsteinense]MBC3790541.1 heme-degrading monooxygenase HmoA [Spirosoma utsteinense]